MNKPTETETTGPDLDLRKPARLECVASSMSGVTIFSVMSVRTVNVGTTMKSMNPVYTEMFIRSAAQRFALLMPG